MGGTWAQPLYLELYVTEGCYLKFKLLQPMRVTERVPLNWNSGEDGNVIREEANENRDDGDGEESHRNNKRLRFIPRPSFLCLSLLVEFLFLVRDLGTRTSELIRTSNLVIKWDYLKEDLIECGHAQLEVRDAEGLSLPLELLEELGQEFCPLERDLERVHYCSIP